MLATKCKHSCKSYNGSRRLALLTLLAIVTRRHLSRSNRRRFASALHVHAAIVVHQASNGTPSALEDSRPTRHVNRQWILKHPASQATQTCRDSRTARRRMALNFSRYGAVASRDARRRAPLGILAGPSGALFLLCNSYHFNPEAQSRVIILKVLNRSPLTTEHTESTEKSQER